MIWRDSETRRLIFYRSCFRMWIFVIIIDLWVLVSLEPEIYTHCHLFATDNEDEIMRESLELEYVPIEIYNFICKQRLKASCVRAYIMQHLKFLVLICIARRFWAIKNTERKKRYKKEFLKRIMKGEVKAHDWLKILENP